MLFSPVPRAAYVARQAFPAQLPAALSHSKLPYHLQFPEISVHDRIFHSPLIKNKKNSRIENYVLYYVSYQASCRRPRLKQIACKNNTIFIHLFLYLYLVASNIYSCMVFRNFIIEELGRKECIGKVDFEDLYKREVHIDHDPSYIRAGDILNI